MIQPQTFYIADTAGFLKKHTYDIALLQQFIWRTIGREAKTAKSPRGNQVVYFETTPDKRQLLENALVNHYHCLWIHILEKDF